MYSFGVWFLSLSIIIVRFIYVVLCILIYSFLLLSGISENEYTTKMSSFPRGVTFGLPFWQL